MEQVVERSESVTFAGAIEELGSEIQRYLETVQLFRELGHEPSWRAELHSSELVVRIRAWLEPREPHVSAL